MKPMRRWLLAPVLTLPLLATGAAAPDPAQTLAGRYYKQSQLRIVGFESKPYTGEDIVEIVPVAPRAAYVRVHLDYDNGHMCAITGVARAEGDALVYRDPRPAFLKYGRCVLTIRRAGKSLSIDDGELTSCSPENCGVRGTLSGVTLPYASKRAIRYLPRLKASSQYRDALTEWRTGKPVGPR